MNFGEISPRLFGRYDPDKPIWKQGVAKLENFLNFKYGGAIFWPGTQYIASAGQTNPVRLEPFRYSISQAYMLELGNLYMRFFANSGQVVSGGNPVQITTPFAQADLFGLQFANKADVDYIVGQCAATGKGYPPQKLMRTGAASFSIAPVSFLRGPFLGANASNVTITPNSATGQTTLTAACPAWGTNTAYITSATSLSDYVTNGGSTYKCLVNHLSGTFATDLAAGYWVLVSSIPVFDTTSPTSLHIGSMWLFTYGSSSGVVMITGVTNSYTATGYVMNEPDGTAGALGGTSAITIWREGAFSNFRGWPTTVIFHEQRIVYGGCVNAPDTFYASNTGEYDNFDLGSAADDNSYTYQLSSDQVAGIRWLSSNTSLQVGTSNGTYTAQSAAGGVGITPSSISVTPDTDYSVSYMQTEKLSSYLYYMAGNGYSLRQLVFSLELNKQKSEDMTALADHILRDGGGAVQMAKQQSPNDRIWIIRADGQIATFTRDVEQAVLGWARRIGGTSSGGYGLFRSVGIFPQDSADDQVWVSVQRTINGSLVNYIELFASEFFTNYWEPIRLDASITVDTPISISGFSLANPCVITAPSHGLANGNHIKIDGIVALGLNSLGQMVQYSSELNGNVFLVANVATNTFSLTDTQGNAINSLKYGTYVSGGQVRKMFTTISGISHLIGETVSVFADGGVPAAQQTFVVSAGGSITLPNPAAVVHIGLPYIGSIQLLPLGDGSQIGTGQGKLRKISLSTLRLFQSLGGTIANVDSQGNISGTMPLISPTQINLPGYHAPVPFTGDLEQIPNSDFVKYNSFLIQQTQPLPFHLLSVILASEVFER